MAQLLSADIAGWGDGLEDETLQVSLASLIKGGTRMSTSLWQDMSSRSKALARAVALATNSSTRVRPGWGKDLRMIFEGLPSSGKNWSMLLRRASTSASWKHKRVDAES